MICGDDELNGFVSADGIQPAAHYSTLCLIHYDVACDEIEEVRINCKRTIRLGLSIPYPLYVHLPFVHFFPDKSLVIALITHHVGPKCCFDELCGVGSGEKEKRF